MEAHRGAETPTLPQKEPPAPDKPDYPTQICEVCDTKMYGLHCKIVCPNCGYKRDCSDP